MRSIHTVICRLFGSTTFSISSHKQHDFQKNYKKSVFFSLKLLSESFLILRRTKRGMIKNEYWSSRKDFNEILNFLNRHSKNIQISNFMKARPTGVRDVPSARTNIHITKVIVAFRNFANAPKNWSRSVLTGFKCFKFWTSPSEGKDEIKQRTQAVTNSITLTIQSRWSNTQLTPSVQQKLFYPWLDWPETSFNRQNNKGKSSP